MVWANLLHIYQPANQKKKILDKVVRESYQKIFFILENNKQIKISLNISGSLTELLIKNGYKRIIQKIRFLAKRNQIELLGSAKFHSFLPLLPEDEIIRQIKLNYLVNRKYFGKIYQPRGFFPPEMAYSQKLAKIIDKLGYQWIILDEIAYQKKFGLVSFDKLYQIKGTNLKVFFRNRFLSDLFLSSWLNSAKKFFRSVSKDKRCKKYILTAMDGENLGHHHKGMAKVWQRIAKKTETKFYSELLKILPSRPQIIEPFPSSWSSKENELEENIPYALWNYPGNMIHYYLWKLLYLVLRLIKKYPSKNGREQLDKYLNSDPFWWASAMPWWYPGFVEDYLNGLEKIVFSSKSIPLKDKKKVINLSHKIKELLREWDKSKKIRKIRQVYKKNKKVNQYFF